jgi:hypothetical protein
MGEMSEWQPIDSAPKDGTWLKVRGHDYGDRTRKRHYAIAFYDNGIWNEVGSEGGLLYYLDGWKPWAEVPSPSRAREE